VRTSSRVALSPQDRAVVTKGVTDVSNLIGSVASPVHSAQAAMRRCFIPALGTAQGRRITARCERPAKLQRSPARSAGLDGP
jgi:hypothetical protein